VLPRPTSRTKFRRLRLWLDTTLFPEAPPPPPITVRRVAIAVAVGLAALVLFILRIDHSTPLDSLWAEDGPDLYQTAMTQNMVTAVASPLSGYVYLVPRLIAEAATVCPVDFAPKIFAILSAAVAVGCGFVVWRASAGQIRSPHLRGALALLVPFAPVSGAELIANAANTPWYMLFAAFWVLIWRPATMASSWAGSIFLFATALTTPLVASLAPLAILRGVAIRGRRDGVMLGGFALGLVIQEITLAFNKANDPTIVSSHWDPYVWREYGERVLGGAFFGLDFGGEIWTWAAWAFWALSLFALAILVALIVSSGSPRVRWMGAICVALSLGLFVFETYARDINGALAWAAGSYHENGARYSIVPALLLLSALFVQLDAKPLRISSRLWRMARGAALVLIAMAVVTSFGQSGGPARGGSRWSDSIARAQRHCESAPRDQSVDIPSSPQGWSVFLPCGDLE
jgi:hypothetical protein